MQSNKRKYALLSGVLFILMMAVSNGQVLACTAGYPALQLDVSNGVYNKYKTNVHSEETIVATDSSFTLYALLSASTNASYNDTYYISMAIYPQIKSGGNLGSFSFNGNTIDVTGDMTYGVPPIERYGYFQGYDSGDLSKHSIYPTYFAEYAFKFNKNNKAKAYDTQNNPGGFTADSTGGFLYAAFAVDVANLSSDYIVHFDLYNEVIKKTCVKSILDVDVNKFAPFSHDAESSPAPAPEPSTMLLLGSGLGGLFTLGSLKKRKLNLEKAAA